MSRNWRKRMKEWQAEKQRQAELAAIIPGQPIAPHQVDPKKLWELAQSPKNSLEKIADALAQPVPVIRQAILDSTGLDWPSYHQKAINAAAAHMNASVTAKAKMGERWAIESLEEQLAPEASKTSNGKTLTPRQQHILTRGERLANMTTDELRLEIERLKAVVNRPSGLDPASLPPTVHMVDTKDPELRGMTEEGRAEWRREFEWDAEAGRWRKREPPAQG